MKIIGYPGKRHKRELLKDSRIELPELLPPAPHENEMKRSKRKKQLDAWYFPKHYRISFPI